MTTSVKGEDLNASRDHASSVSAATPRSGSALPPVFVFGSNLAGRHGKGAALWARQHRGAEYGVGSGHTGNSYALPTKGFELQTLPLDEIEHISVRHFLDYARARPDLTFQLTPVGCGLAGYSHDQIAPMFAKAPANVIMPPEFRAVLANTPTPAGSDHEERPNDR